LSQSVGGCHQTMPFALSVLYSGVERVPRFLSQSNRCDLQRHGYKFAIVYFNQWK
jgi:hypothetical protein